VQGYLAERGLSSGTIEAFGLGYALPAWDDLAKALRSGGYKEGELQKAGLIVPRASGGFIDRFRGRVIFPIGDAQGRTVGFGGRILGEGEPKYLNSPETPLYNKSRILYGFDKARDDIRKEGFGIVVEGYFDCIALHQAGFRNVVATSGTALTEGHLKLMQRFSERWTVVFDGDAAGIRAARRSLELFITQGLFARCVLLPTDEDPDTFIRKKGTDAFRTLLDGAESLMEFFISQSAQQHSTGTVEGKVAAVREVVPLLAKVKERVARAEYVGFAAHRLGVKEEVLWSEVQAASSREKPGVSAARGGAQAAGPVKAEEAGIVRAMLSSESVAARMKEEVSLEDLEDEDCRAVAGKIFSLIDDGRGKEIARGLRFDEERLNRFVAPWLVDEERFSDEETALREARDCLAKIRRRRIDHQSSQLQEKIVQAEKSGNKDMLHKLLRIKHELRVQTGREHREARR
jgi:DNA primase